MPPTPQHPSTPSTLPHHIYGFRVGIGVPLSIIFTESPGLEHTTYKCALRLQRAAPRRLEYALGAKHRETRCRCATRNWCSSGRFRADNRNNACRLQRERQCTRRTKDNQKFVGVIRTNFLPFNNDLIFFTACSQALLSVQYRQFFLSMEGPKNPEPPWYAPNFIAPSANTSFILYALHHVLRQRKQWFNWRSLCAYVVLA